MFLSIWVGVLWVMLAVTKACCSPWQARWNDSQIHGTDDAFHSNSPLKLEFLIVKLKEVRQSKVFFLSESSAWHCLSANMSGFCHAIRCACSKSTRRHVFTLLSHANYHNLLFLMMVLSNRTCPPLTPLDFILLLLTVLIIFATTCVLIYNIFDTLPYSNTNCTCLDNTVYTGNLLYFTFTSAVTF